MTIQDCKLGWVVVRDWVFMVSVTKQCSVHFYNQLGSVVQLRIELN
jgi:hypothetical protein